MLGEERKRKIIEIIDTEGIVQIQQLADFFKVSIYTIRRDLTELQRSGLLKKTHGGAVRIQKSSWLPSVEEGEREAAEEKKAIAYKASQYIGDGDTIFLMGSTISHMMIPFIKEKRITIVTNSLDIAKVYSGYERIEIIVTGGRVKNYKGNILGSHAVDDVKNYHFDKAFIPCAGIHYKNGISTSTIDSADFTKAVINSSEENIAVADYRKIGRITFCKICDITSVNRLITDDKADKDELESMYKKGMEIDIVKINENET